MATELQLDGRGCTPAFPLPGTQRANAADADDRRGRPLARPSAPSDQLGNPRSVTVHISCPTVPDAALLLPEDDEAFFDLDYCCDGAALRGRGYCTCWTPIFDMDQQPVQEGPMVARSKCCHDCAFRQGSPERESGDLDSVEGKPFHCHQGVRRATSYRHPCGIEVPTGPGDYQPPVQAGPRLWKADGTPGELCAGYAVTAGHGAAATQTGAAR